MPKVIRPDQLAAALRGEAKGVLQSIRRGAKLAAHRGRAHLIAETDRKGVTDRGQYKNSFRVLPGTGTTMATLINDAPYAGIIELGARPHPVSQEGLQAIAEWVKRKFNPQVFGPAQRVRNAKGRLVYKKPSNDDAAMDIARAIARKIAREGQKAKHVFADSIETLTRYLHEEVEAQIRKGSNP